MTDGILTKPAEALRDLMLRRRLGVAETAQVENIIRTIKQNGEPLILISHNMRQVFDLVDRIVVFRRGRIAANLKKSETNGEEVVAYITGAKTDPALDNAA